VKEITRPGRVWIVGAGASASFGMPTIDELLDECLDQNTNYRHRELLTKILDYLYPSVQKRGNIEEFMSLLDTWIQMNDDLPPIVIPVVTSLSQLTQLQEQVAGSLTSYEGVSDYILFSTAQSIPSLQLTW
jgi:hypothetical protein